MEKVNFEKSNGLAPAIIQDANTQKVLMLGYMNEDALKKTIADQQVIFFSRSKNRLWKKGESSGNLLKVKDILFDCDHDTILIKAIPTGPVCHKGTDTCFDEVNENKDFLSKLQQVIKKRKLNPKKNSHTSRLFNKGINKIAQKVGEEAVELIIESKDDNIKLFKEEAADLLFHYLILLEAKDISFNEIIDILKKRNK